MFVLENALKLWKQNLVFQGVLTRDDIAELESHIEDEIRDKVKEGAKEEDAFAAALVRIGKTDELRNEYSKVNWRTVFLERLGLMLSGILLFGGCYSLSLLLNYLFIYVLVSIGCETRSIIPLFFTSYILFPVVIFALLYNWFQAMQVKLALPLKTFQYTLFLSVICLLFLGAMAGDYYYLPKLYQFLRDHCMRVVCVWVGKMRWGSSFMYLVLMAAFYCAVSFKNKKKERKLSEIYYNNLFWIILSEILYIIGCMTQAVIREPVVVLMLKYDFPILITQIIGSILMIGLPLVIVFSLFLTINSRKVFASFQMAGVRMFVLAILSIVVAASSLYAYHVYDLAHAFAQINNLALWKINGILSPLSWMSGIIFPVLLVCGITVIQSIKKRDSL